MGEKGEPEGDRSERGGKGMSSKRQVLGDMGSNVDK
jgi:hypothetical protein